MSSSTVFEGKNVLVTGGAGFIGCALAHSAHDAASWVAMDNLHPQVHPEGKQPDLPESARLFIGDVTKESDWSALLSIFRPEIVIHLAAETGTGQSLSEASRHASVNVLGTTQLLDALSRHNIAPELIVLTSSRAVYGEGEWINERGDSASMQMRTHQMLNSGIWDFEGHEAQPSSHHKTKPAPTSIYGATKLAQENIVRAWCGSHDVGFAILRLQNVYGPGQSLTNSYTGIVALFAQLAAEDQPIPLYEDGNVVRDFVFINDVVRSIHSAVHRGVQNQELLADVGSGVPTTIMGLAKAISSHYGSPAPIVTGQFRDGDVRYACADPSGWKDLGSWEPTVSLEEGIEHLSAWIAKEKG